MTHTDKRLRQLDFDAKLFVQLTLQSGQRRLIRVQLPAGKFPFVPLVRVGTAPREANAIALD
jgi:hypothetical protein